MSPGQNVILLFTLQSLKSEGSWCGETHVQKTTYLSQELLGVPSKFKFVLYKHGPYSFEVSENLQGLIADQLVELASKPPYGPSLELSNSAKYFASKIALYPELEEKVSFIAKKLGKKGVADLEKLATAVFVNARDGSDKPLDVRAKTLNSIKSHIPVDAAKAAFLEVEDLRAEIANAFVAVG